MRITYLATALVLLIQHSLQVKAQCTKGYTYPISKRCDLYLKCESGSLRLTKCSKGTYYDSLSRICVEGEFVKDCDGMILSSFLGRNLDKSVEIEEEGEISQVGVSTEGDNWTGTDATGVSGSQWPNEFTTEGNDWTGTDNGRTGTEWPHRKGTTDGDYWPGTDGTGMTGTAWPSGTTESNWVGNHYNEISGTEGPNGKYSTEGDYWTGTDGTGMTGSVWPAPDITTEGHYWTGTDSGRTGTEWPSQTVTTEGNYWTGTDGTGQTGTEWPIYISTSEGTPTEWTVTQGSATHGFSTQTVTDSTVTMHTHDPSDKTTPNPHPTHTPSHGSTATEWTVTENIRTDTTGSEWTVTPMPHTRNNVTTPKQKS